ncbi:hypothetical protein [Thalassotalea atypica]|uniref:hypothetical protein n=1 Tax=Thalassotalea atypica TaxID=2054316 RepID=UPI0025732CF6|nr:hypothetical protein [Thalassotalea atypica]
MTALKEQQHLADDIKLVFDMTEKPNRTQLKAHPDRAVVAKLRADLVLPSDKILTVDIDFDTESGYHNNTMLVMDDFGVKLLAAGFKAEYGAEFADKILDAWNNKKDQDDPRKPTYMLVQKPKDDNEFPRVFVACGSKDHKPDQKSPTDIL